MTEPRRLLEEDASDFEAKMLGAARSETPSQGGIERTLVAMGLSAAATAVTVSGKAAAGTASIVKGAAGAGLAGSAGAPVSLGALWFAKWVGLGVLLGSFTLVGTRLASTTNPPQQPRTVQPRLSAAAQAPPVLSAATAVSSETPRETPSTRIPASQPMVVVSPTQTHDVPTPQQQDTQARAMPSSLTDEIHALEAARVAVSRGDGPAAIAALEAFDRRFPAGSLGPEAGMLRVQALLMAGNRSAALSLARGLLASNPRSPHGPQLRQWFPELSNL